jgi:hypothetical protein
LYQVGIFNSKAKIDEQRVIALASQKISFGLTLQRSQIIVQAQTSNLFDVVAAARVTLAP